MDASWKSNFRRSQEVAYLDTAAEGLPPSEAEHALRRYIEDKSLGTPGRVRLFEAERETIALAARLLATAPENVNFLAHASEALNLLANSIKWQAGDEIVIADLEFPSNVVVWLRLREQGVKVRVIASEAGIVTLNQFTSQLGPRTRLVSVSQVSYRTGTRIPFLAELASEVRRAGAVLCVDATQALGRVPVFVEHADFLVASTYKWLLGSHGLGVVYMGPQLGRTLRLASAGWYSIENIFSEDRFRDFRWKHGAASLNTGMPNFPALYVLRESLRFLNGVGVDRLNQTLAPLVVKLRSSLGRMGLQLLTPPGAEYASGIVSFAHRTPEKIGAALEREGVIVWAGDGRVRASVHLYNDEADIDRFLAALEKVIA